MTKFSYARLAVVLAGLAAGSHAFAASTWDWRTGPGTCDVTTCVADGVTATVSGYGATTSASNFVAATPTNQGSSGLGMTSAGENTTSPNHSIDNLDGTGGGAGYAELLAINFTQAVRLTQVAVGWTSTDSDAMIFAFTGTGNPFSGTNFTSKNPGSLPTALGIANATNGWSMVASGQFAATSGAAGLLNFTGLYSSYFLVSTALGQGSGTNHNDGFKVSTFTGDLCAGTVSAGVCTPPSGSGGGGGAVPEPASLALTAMALFGVYGTRRRKAKAA